MSKSDLARMIEAFSRLEAEGFTMGPNWETVHTICQAHEGERSFDWGHALCHRIEGDDGNADYWYRRAGKKRSASIAEDGSAVKAELSTAL
jgi:hypothetical protein